MTLLAERVWAPLRCWPGLRSWVLCLLVALPGVALIAAIVIPSGFVHYAPIADPGRIVRALVTLFFLPALGEEPVFRGLLVPSRPQPFGPLGWVVAIGAFLVWHLVEALGFGPPWLLLFLRADFLAAVVVLGLVLVAQRRISGSLWPCILTHWLLIAAWKLLFGGPF